MKDITVAIVAGGSSKRFGSEKSLAEFQGKPLLTYMLNVAQQISSNILVVVSDEEQKAVCLDYDFTIIETMHLLGLKLTI